MKTTVFDLIWKLKRALENEGHEKIDLHRFTHEKDYRREILLNIDISELPFNKGLQEIYKDLLSTDELDLAKEVELPKDETKVAPIVAEKPKASSNTPVYVGFAVIAVLLFGLAFVLFNPTSDKQPEVIQSTAPAQQVVTTAPAAPPAVAQAPQVSTAPTPAQGISAPIPIKAVKQEAPQQQTLFRIYGSNTIGEVLAPELIKAFYKDEGVRTIELQKTDVEVENNLLVTLPGHEKPALVPIHAHGSSTGFKALDKGITDLAMASRRIKDKEISLLSSRYGNLSAKSSEHIIGMDGLAVIVNPDNPINSLSTEQLAKLFSGNSASWKEFGGPDLPVKVFARDANSGTWDSFKSMVLKKHGVKLVDTAERIESSVELSDKVSKTPGAIGFIGLPYVLRSKALAVSDDENGQAIFPTSFTISTEDYPLVRRLYIYEPNTVTTFSDAHRFIAFVLSEAGQEVVKKAGFISQNVYKTRPLLTAGLPQNYLQATNNSERLSLNFRFKSGTVLLDNKAERDLQRVVEFFERNPGQQAMLIGFSDSIGEPTANAALSLQRARAVEAALLSRGINVQQTLGMGEAAPIASNQTRIGRERNRRVEIWVQSNTEAGFNTAIR